MRWEYQFLAVRPDARSSNDIDSLNELGNDGWEAVAMYAHPNGTVRYLLKRAVK